MRKMWKSIREFFYSIFRNVAKNLKYTFKSIFKNAIKPLKMFFFFIENILRLTKHNLEVKRFHNFRKKLIYGQEKTYSDLTIVSRTNGVLSSTEISFAFTSPTITACLVYMFKN